MLSSNSPETFFDSARMHLLNAENSRAQNDIESASSHAIDAINDLRSAACMLLNESALNEIAQADKTVAKIIRRFASDSGILPENFGEILAAFSNPQDILGFDVTEISTKKLSAEEIFNTVKSVYETEFCSGSQKSDIENLKIALNLYSKIEKITAGVFSKNGVYDMFAGVVSPYLTAGAAFIASDEEELLRYEDAIPGMLGYEIKHLSRFLWALTGCVFISGLLLLISKRVLACTQPGELTQDELEITLKAIYSAFAGIVELKNTAGEHSSTPGIAE